MSTVTRLRDRISQVVLDWDETITESDTMSILARSTAAPDKWQGYVDAYMADMKAYEESFGPRDTLQTQFRFLGGLSGCELKSVARIESAGAFKGVTHSDLQQVAKQVVIRPGFDEFCGRLPSSTTKEILSVNWSSEFIRYAMPDSADPESWKITANHITFDTAGRGTGAVSKDKTDGIRTALDKLKILKDRILASHAKDALLVYIGDSNTDLPALLAADIGIIFGDNTSLLKNCKMYDIAVRPLSQLDTTQPYVKQELLLYQAHQWAQVVF